MSFQVDNTVRSRILMPDVDMQPGEKAIFAFLESTALGLALTGIERLASARSIGSSIFPLFLLIASPFVSYAGFKWPQLKSKIEVASSLERIASNYRYRVFAVLLVAFGISGYLIMYLHSLRSDLDAYVMPRTVTDTQAAEIRKVLSAHESTVPINVFASAGDPEATEYAGQLTIAITGGGWDARNIPINHWDISDPEKHGGDFYNIYVALDQGVLIRTCTVGQPTNPDPKHPTPEAILRMAFGQAQINVGGGGKYNCAKNSLIVEVGRRPIAINQQPPLSVRLGRWLMNSRL